MEEEDIEKKKPSKKKIMKVRTNRMIKDVLLHVEGLLGSQDAALCSLYALVNDDMETAKEKRDVDLFHASKLKCTRINDVSQHTELVSEAVEEIRNILDEEEEMLDEQSSIIG